MELDNQSHLVITNEWFHLSYRLVSYLIVGFIASLVAVYWLASRGGDVPAEPIFTPMTTEQQEDFLHDRHRVHTLQVQAHQHLEVLTEHVGRIEANLLRINALGERLVQSLQLDPHEFNFSETNFPGLGTDARFLDHDPLLNALKAYEVILEKRYIQMASAQQSVQTNLAKQEMVLKGSGNPVVGGYVSSFYGYRKDPMHGRKAWHAGVDIAGREGAEIKALAAGIVRYAAVKGGYGRLIEIDHGNGLLTRYGHNKSLLVQRGQVVHKGERIALVGSSGRSTGPHVHLEVHKNGETIDPGRYFPDLTRS